MAVIALVVKAQMQKNYTGSEGMVGESGEAVTDVHEEGRIFVEGEYWNAFSEENIEKGKRVKVVRVEGFKLKVQEV